MNNREKRLFNVAREVSFLGDYPAARVGAVVTEGKTIIGTGCNSNKTRTRQFYYNKYRHFEKQNTPAREHAEMAALSPLIGKEIEWGRVSLYIYRETKDGVRGCSRPCPACAALIRDLGIKQVYFINEFGDFTKERII